jgi:hypothetical protein
VGRQGNPQVNDGGLYIQTQTQTQTGAERGVERPGWSPISEEGG